MSVCRACDATLVQSGRGRHRVYCDSRCKDRYKRRVGLKPRYTRLLPCSVPDCTGEGVGRTLCNMHQLRQRRGLSDCETLGCAAIAHVDGYCRAHAPVSVPYAECRCGSTYVKRGGLRLCQSCRSPGPVMATCKTCRADYERKRPGQRYCESCRPQHQPWTAAERKCAHCRGAFTELARNQRFCSRRCAKRSERDRRRLREVAQFIEEVDRFTVFERDGYICQVCGEDTLTCVFLPGPLWAHPLEPTLDHRIPVGRWGPHGYANAQTVHRKCNSLKSDHVDPLIRPKRRSRARAVVGQLGISV